MSRQQMPEKQEFLHTPHPDAPMSLLTFTGLHVPPVLPLWVFVQLPIPDNGATFPPRKSRNATWNTFPSSGRQRKQQLSETPMEQLLNIKK